VNIKKILTGIGREDAKWIHMAAVLNIVMNLRVP
jgi:hypothetical protein